MVLAIETLLMVNLNKIGKSLFLIFHKDEASFSFYLEKSFLSSIKLI